MPLYVYQCNNCGEQLEARQKFSDDPLKECPHCGAPEGLYRVIQNAGVVFKGSGFYINDSKGSKQSLTGASKSDTSTSSTESSSGDSKSSSESSSSSDSKPSKKSDKSAD